MSGSTPSKQESTFSVSNIVEVGYRYINPKTILLVYTALVVIYIYLPMISLFVFSVNEGGLSFPFTGFTTEWYAELLSSPEFRSAIILSLKLALVTTVITTILATMAALGFRYEYRGKRAILFLFLLGIVVPGFSYGFGSLLMLNNVLGLPRGFWLAIPVEVIWTFPFGFIILIAGFPPKLPEQERAARVLGASKLKIYREIIFPQIGLTILGTALFAFTLAYNEGTRNSLVLGTETTIPSQISAVVFQTSPTPRLFALGVVTTVFSSILLIIAGLAIFGVPDRD